MPAGIFSGAAYKMTRGIARQRCVSVLIGIEIVKDWRRSHTDNVRQYRALAQTVRALC